MKRSVVESRLFIEQAYRKNAASGKVKVLVETKRIYLLRGYFGFSTVEFVDQGNLIVGLPFSQPSEIRNLSISKTVFS